MRWLSVDSLSSDSNAAAMLKDLVRDAQIVVLGEELHGDGATFAAKSKLARFLLSEAGFDTMGWESPIYDVREMNRLADEVSDDAFAARGIFSIWHGAEVDPLIRFCRERGIQHAGVDCQILDRTALASDIAYWASQVGIPLRTEQAESFLSGEDDESEPTFQRLLFRLAERGRSWPAVAVENVLANRHQQRAGHAMYGPYLEAKERGEVLELDPFDATLVAANSLRDEAMGANAARLAEQGRRTVLWAANYHAIRSLAQTSPYSDHAPHVRTMGDVLHKKLGSKSKSDRWNLAAWDAMGPRLVGRGVDP